MDVGAGVLLSAITYEIVPESMIIGAGMELYFALGALAFFVFEWLVDRRVWARCPGICFWSDVDYAGRRDDAGSVRARRQAGRPIYSPGIPGSGNTVINPVTLCPLRNYKDFYEGCYSQGMQQAKLNSNQSHGTAACMV